MPVLEAVNRDRVSSERATGVLESMSLKVLHICSYYSSKLYSLLLEELCKVGIENSVFYFGKYGYRFPNGEGAGVKCVECYSEFDRLFFRRKEGKVWAALREDLPGDYNLLHAHSLFSNGYLAYRAKRQFGIPYVVAVRNTDVNVFFRFRRSLRRLGISILMDASSVVFISPVYKERLLSDYVPPTFRLAIDAKSVVIPNGIDELFFRDDGGFRPSDQRGAVILQVGKVSQLKNQIATLTACELLRLNGWRDITYKVIGPVEDRAIANRLDDCDFVERIDNVSQEQLIDHYRSASVMCMPSLHETFGLSYIEAMSQGTPVIYSRGEGIDGYFSDGEVGYPVDPKSPRQIADAIQRIVDEGDALRTRCAARAMAFRWNRIAAKYADEVYADHLAVTS